MPLPPILKSPLVLSGSGVASVGGIGVTIWQATLNEQSPSDDAEKDKGLEEQESFDPESENPLPKDKHGCFENFFPGVQIRNRYLNDPYGRIIDSASWGPIRRDWYKRPLGCAFMRHSYTDQYKISFEAAVAIKNDSVGWILWTYGTGSRSGDLTLLYKIILLSNSRYTWDVNGGYSWLEREHGEYISLSHIIAQDQNWIRTPSDENPTPTSRYFGIWFSGGFKQTILSTVTSSYFEYLNHSQIFRRIDTTDYPYNQSGPDLAHKVYDPNKKGWFYYPVGDTLKKNLRKWYVPFMKSKGYWVTFRDEEPSCKGDYYNDYRSKAGDDFVEHMKSLCAKSTTN